MVWIVVPLVIMVAAWQPVRLPPLGGLDPSWQAGLAMARHTGLTFGTQVVWTYGPLGFLSDTTLWFNHLAVASMAYTIVSRFGLAAALFVCARRTFGNVVAFLLATIVASVAVELQEPVIVLCCGVWMVTRSGENERRSLWLSGALGALSAIEVLNKQSIGVSLVALTAVTILSLPGARGKHAAVAGGAGIMTFLVCWLALGQALGAVPDYLENAIQISSGYAGAMSLDAGGLGWAYTAAAVAIAVGVWAAVTMTETGTARARAWGGGALDRVLLLRLQRRVRTRRSQPRRALLRGVARRSLRLPLAAPASARSADRRRRDACVCPCAQCPSR